MKKIFLVLALLAISYPAIAADAIQAAEQDVKAQLKDPSSAQFSGLRTFDHSPAFKRGTKHTVVCGYVNAKNAMGGYAGKMAFISLGGGNVQLDTDPDADNLPDVTGYMPYSFPQLAAAFCQNGKQESK